ncbi:M4 family metallopeptidase [Flexivirga sp. ID2601S]|uniref:Neutral metalloproteinase n=1 Tax=Flexivirga aerilata TaxID=1656889 RepID=A0A849AMZ0_9MICO|nr:M4 family metallopeptidase [Flexivirga aerilata]NNG38172.1 M4 family metallopeptidase [Flexivirga aerilata]
MATPRQRFFVLTACCAVTAATAVAGAANAAPGGNDRVRSTNAVSVGSPKVDRAVKAVDDNRGRYGLSADQKLTRKSALTDDNGTTHVRAQQTYKGLPVIGGDLVIHQTTGGAVTISRTLGKPLSLDTKSAAAAPKMKGAQGNSRLVVDTVKGAPKLAWETTVTGVQADGTPSRKLVYTDAKTGVVIRSEERVMTVGGQGNSLYGGTVPLELTQSGANYLMKDPTRGNTYTIDVNNQTDSVICQYFGSNCATGPVFSGPDTSFGNGTTSSRESAGVDAQFGTDETWDYYKTNFGRNGIFNTGKGSYNRVHYGQGYVNAFWDGTKMTYGDGDGANYGPLTSLDVAGHEMSHGVTENSANLTYSGESGGLNESTSDIFGTMVEFFSANAKDTGDYLIGEMFDKTGKGLRRMDNPAADGKSANCWSSSVGSLNVHYSSGVGNHFYYLLAEGSGAKTINGVAHNSPTCDGSSVAGIGRSDAQQIWYRALTVYMTSSTNYAGARTATLNAAKDLYGATSAQYTAVGKAWSAVNVN